LRARGAEHHRACDQHRNAGPDASEKRRFSYNPPCASPGGNPGQATHIANATGGQFAADQSREHANTITDLVRRRLGHNNAGLVPAGAMAQLSRRSHCPEAMVRCRPIHRARSFDGRTGVAGCKDEAQVLQERMVADTVVAQSVEVTVPACKAITVFSYSVKFVWHRARLLAHARHFVRRVRHGDRIHNHTDKLLIIKQRPPCSWSCSRREPRAAKARAEDKMVLPPHTATMDDCCRIAELLLERLRLLRTHRLSALHRKPCGVERDRGPHNDES
jgi:hypothetical protein